MSSRRHKSTFDIFGKELIFHDRRNNGNDYSISNSTGNDNTLDLKMKFIQLNSKWRINIDTEELKFEKYNIETENFDVKFKIS